MITAIEDYFTLGCGRCSRFATPDCSTRPWADGLAHLRLLCLSVGLGEAVKWAHPCYIHAGRPVALIGAFRSDFRLSFFEAALLTDPAGLLEKSGPHTRHPDVIRFRANDEVAAREPVVRAYLLEALAHAEAGRRAPKPTAALELPDELS